MATDPKKDQKDQPDPITPPGKSAELTDEQLKNLSAAGDPGSIPMRPDDPLQAPRHD